VRIAVLGTRGVPPAYGGFETFADQLARRLAERGHSVAVYCRPGRTGTGPTAPGVERLVLPCIRSKYFETVSHTALSALHALYRRYDAIVMCNAANAVFAWIPRLRGSVVVLNVDGLEANRAKWSSIGRAYYRLSERISLRTPNQVVSDARVVQTYYRRRYGAKTVYIPYGAEMAPHPVPAPSEHGPMNRFGLRPRSFVLYVSRLEPENHAHTVAAAFSECTELPLELVITGNAPYARSYIRTVLMAADSRTVFTGGVYGDGYHELQAHARCYVHATTVGGVHPALIEAMAHGSAIVCADTPENRETLGEAGVFYTPDDVAACADALRRVCGDEQLSAHLGALARQRALSEYSWEHVTDAYERLIEDLRGPADTTGPAVDKGEAA
jgi:glycosyltransferase involved in cell wall biosynthesis